MNKKALRADILLLLTAAIWGFGFVAQRSGMEYIGPFAFNGIRFILGSLSLLPFILVRRRCYGARTVSQKRLLLSSLAAGSFLFIAVIFQQFGIIFTTAGNAGFITGLYVVLTPIFGIFLGRKTGLVTWIGSVLTLTGLYFISVAGSPGSINPGDMIVVISAFFWTAHVLLIDRLMNVRQMHSESSIGPLELSAGQFAVCGILSLLGAFFVEPFVGTAIEHVNPSLLSAGLFEWQPFPAFITSLKTRTVSFPVSALTPILYGGLGSVGIAYTLQVIAQRDAPPAHATIILSFEGCFAALGGVLLLSEKAGAWTLLGFIFMLVGMMATQWEVIAKGFDLRRT
jgi:drug/metabolite transporter (DMT)-like permease